MLLSIVLACRPEGAPGPGPDDGSSSLPTSPPYRPFPQHTLLWPGTLRPDRAPSDLEDDVRRAYDRWRSRYVASAGPAADGTELLEAALRSFVADGSLVLVAPSVREALHDDPARRERLVDSERVTRDDLG